MLLKGKTAIPRRGRRSNGKGGPAASQEPDTATAFSSAVLRSSSASRATVTNRSSESAAAAARSQSNPKIATNTRYRVNQQQQQQQQQQQSGLTRNALTSSSSSSSSLNGAEAALRGSNEQLGGRFASNSTQDLCDNSNDSGLGFEDRHQQLSKAAVWNGRSVVEEERKRRKMDIKLESEDANFAFPEALPGSQSEAKVPSRNGIGVNGARSASNANGSVNRVVGVTRPRPHLSVLGKRAPPAHQGPVTLTSQLSTLSRNGKTQLQIICQPEQQHRARYQTEGSRGAVKDRTGNGFPIVRLVNYDKPAILQVFIGTDLGRVAPHMFYQACRVSGKNSTPCVERKIDGTIVIEVDMDPVKDMMVTCDCVGILKERNVDVEHRFPQETGVLQGRSKKKSTRCRMIFRTTITHDDGTNETLQICSHPIVCTQPPGVPEICKKSLTSCPCTGGLELFILGKNFLKDTRIVFQLDGDDMSSSLEPHWECTVLPDKEFLQQTHLVCVVPAYRRQNLAPSETVSVKLYAVSSGKASEPHTFLYTATSTPPSPSVGKLENTNTSSMSNSETGPPPSKIPSSALAVPSNVSPNGLHPVPVMLSQASASPANFLKAMQPSNVTSAQNITQDTTLKSDPSPPPVTAAQPTMMWSNPTTNGQVTAADMMMPPPPNLGTNPLMNRRPSSGMQMILPDNLKTEVLDENSQNSLISGDNSMPGLPNSTHNGATVTSPLEQLVNENSRESSQQSLIRGTAPPNSSPVQDALLGVVDLMRNQHTMSIMPQHQTFSGLIDQVKVLPPHHISKDSNPIIANEASISSNMHSSGVVDLRMKHHQPEFNGLGNGALGSFAATPADEPLPAQSGQSIEKYLNQIASEPKKNDPQNANFAGTSIISNGQPEAVTATSNLLSAVPDPSNIPLGDLVSSAVESHQMVSPLRSANPSPNVMMNHVTDHESAGIVGSPQQQAPRTSPPAPCKTMLLDALMPTANVSPLSTESNESGLSLSGPVSVPVPMPVVPVSVPVPISMPVVQEPTPDDSLLKSINAALMPTIQDSSMSIGSTANASVSVSGSVNVNAHNPMQVSNEVMPSVATAMQALAQQDPVSIQQQVQQVEQVVAHAQQQVEQVVAQAQQQAVQAVQQAQQQVVQQVVQHAQVVQQAVQQVQAVQQAPTAPAVQQAVQQATQEVVQQAVQQATQEVVQQVQAVQQAVQQAQAAQAMQQAVQQDIGSMLSQPAGFVAEASSALASGAAQEPSQQRLTNAAEQAINDVITNATQDIINNRPITTTTAHAIIATKNILNTVATKSAQLMNSAMEGILPKSPGTTQQIVEQVASNSPPVAIPMQTTPTGPPVVAMQQNNDPPPQSQQQQQQQQPQQQQTHPNNGNIGRKADGTNPGNMMTQDLMSDHELMNYINSSCFDPQNGFLM